MNNKLGAKHFFMLAIVTVVWTLIVIGFSTSMGSRPLRIYDWGPPVGACLLTMVCMVRDQRKRAANQ